MAFCTNIPAVHIFAVVLGCLEIMMFGGVIFGWHSVVYVYKDTDYFSSHCPSSTASPSLNNSRHYHEPSDSSAANFNTSIDITAFVLKSGDATTEFSIKPSSRQNITVLTDAKDAKAGVGGDLEGLTCREQMEARGGKGVSAVCKDQDEQFNLVFSLATGINGILSFPSGILYDKLGTRISRYVAIVSFMAGQFCLIFASPETSYLLYPGFIGLVYGGYQILLTNLQLSGLIPALRSTLMSLYSGAYDTSSSVFLVFKAAHEAGVPINYAFAVQAAAFFLMIVGTTVCLFPKGRVPFVIDQTYRLRCWLCHRFCRQKTSTDNVTAVTSEWKIDPYGSAIIFKGQSMSKEDLNDKGLVMEILIPSDDFGNLKCADRNSTDGMAAVEKEAIDSAGDCQTLSTQGLPAGDFSSQKEKNPSDVELPEGERMLQKRAKEGERTFRQVACSRLFLTDLLWISFHRLRSWIFVGMFNPWITRLACGDKTLVSHYTSVYAGLQFFGMLTAPLSGRLMDRKIKGAEKYGNRRYERLHASIASFLLNSSVSVLLTVCTLIPVLQLQYLTFVLHCLHRSFLYGPNSAFVANGFPPEHFGKLFGITLTVSAMFSMLQYPLFLIMQGPLDGDPFAINLFLLVLMVLSYIHPFYIWRFLQKKLAENSA